jgi:hypothetical protein
MGRGNVDNQTITVRGGEEARRTEEDTGFIELLEMDGITSDSSRGRRFRLSRWKPILNKAYSDKCPRLETVTSPNLAISEAE